MGKFFSISVGANSVAYPAEARLRFAERDAQRFHAAVQTQRIFSDADHRLFDRDVDSSDVVAAVVDVARLAGPDDAVVVFFAGHGTLESVGSESELFLAVHATDLRRVEHTAIRVQVVREALESSRARWCVLVLDSCFSGSAIGRSLPGLEYLAAQASGRSIRSRAPEIDGEGRLILAATSGKAVALETALHRAGFFTHALLEASAGSHALLSRALIEVFATTRQLTASATRGEQVPVIIGKDAGIRFPLWHRSSGRTSQ